ncbi:putative membrane protein (plasmid) [Bacillus pseudomycoides]|nr:putative membrane protein [Bacillus pseudomycoides]AIK35583.1 putative membrane protein [Bacillus pseudomycoides]AJI14619.1 putative membrane protein [Bacillus pseudomycoides]AJI14695.1 putative membrane protein [Bacillus pseudomycoides]AJI14723.1 putative membrane protein [Bacillus pseudomycoides]
MRGGNHMAIAMAVLKFIGGLLPFVQELLKAVM